MKKAPRKKTYLLFRRYMSGVCTTCLIVTVAASARADASVTAITIRALMVWGAIAVTEWVLVKTWSAWETTNTSEAKK